MRRLMVVLGLVIVVGLMGAGIALAQATGAPAKTQPAPAKQTEPAKAVDTVERYWNMQVEKLGAQAQHLKDVAGAYEKKAAESQTAKEAQARLDTQIKDLQTKLEDQMKAIDKKYDDVIADEKKDMSAEHKELNAKRDAWLAQHPEVNDRVKAMNKDIADLKVKVEDLKAKEKIQPKSTPTKTTP